MITSRVTYCSLLFGANFCCNTVQHDALLVAEVAFLECNYFHRSKGTIKDENLFLYSTQIEHWKPMAGQRLKRDSLHCPTALSFVLCVRIFSALSHIPHACLFFLRVLFLFLE